MTLSEVHDNKLSNCCLILMLFVSCLTPCECCPVPGLPCTACFCCALLSLHCSWAVLICRTSFSSGLHISWLSWSILPPGRELKDGRAAIPVGLSWAASVGFSRGMAGREWSGWMELLESRRVKIPHHPAVQSDLRNSSAAERSDPSGRVVVPVWQTGC